MNKELELYETLLNKKKQEGLENLLFFNKNIMERNPERRKLFVPHVHGVWADWYKESTKRIKMILVPRGCFKSTFFTVGRSIQALCQNRNERILIANATLNNAQTFISEIKDHLIKNEELRQLYGDFYDPHLKWNENEIVVTGRSSGVRENSVTAVGVGGNLVSQHYSKIICDDLVNLENSATRLQADKVIDWWKRAFSLLDYDGEMIIIGCLTKDAGIMMADGSRKDIVDVEVGDMVCSYSDKGLVANRVLAVIPQGEDEVFEVRTPSSKIKGNARHAFLKVVVDRGVKTKRLGGWQKIYEYHLEWSPLSKLERGDFVVVFNGNSGEEPKKYNDDLIWLLGFMFGDGWVTHHKNSHVVCIAKSNYSILNLQIRNIFKERFGKDLKETKFGYYQCYSKEIGDYLTSLGLDKGAKNKRIPIFIYSLPRDQREFFIKGLIDADGWRYSRGNSYGIELSNLELVRDLQHLCRITGIRVSNITSRTREILAPHSKESVTSETHTLQLRFSGKNYGRGYKSVLKENKLPRDFALERIISIESAGRENVYDLTVEKDENYIAEGTVVHNTRWSYYELYSWIVEKYPNSIDTYIKGAYNPDGSLYFPELLNEEKLLELKGLQGSYVFSAFYLNDPVDEDSALIKRSMVKYYGPGEANNLPANLNIFAVCDPAVSQSGQSDYSCILVIGVNSENDWYVLEVLRDKWTVGELIEQLFAVNALWKPITISIEMIGQAQGLLTPIHDEENRRNKYLPLFTILVRPDIKKEMRIRSVLQPRFERGKIFIRREDFELEAEIISFPRGKHDDMIDAMTDMDEISFTPEPEKTTELASNNYFENLLKKIDEEKNPGDPFMGEDF